MKESKAFYCESCGLTIFKPQPSVNVTLTNRALARALPLENFRWMTYEEIFELVETNDEINSICAACAKETVITMRPNPNLLSPSEYAKWVKKIERETSC